MGRTNVKANKKFTSRMQARLLLVFCVVTISLVGLMGRLIYITHKDGERYAKYVLSRDTYVSNVLPYRRGSIMDRNGTVLAESQLQYRLILDPKRLNEYPDSIETTLKALKDYFDIDNETVRAILTDEKKSTSRYVTLLKNLTFDVVDSFKKVLKEDKNNSIVGLWFDQEYVRNYPYHALACDVLGFTSADNTGYWGIEEYYNNELNGTNGREYGYYDSSLNIDRVVKEPVHGNSIITTLDANVQRIVQEKIAEFNKETGSLSIGVLVMDPNNGDILAMASNQEYDLNNPRDLSVLYTEDEINAMTNEEKNTALNALWKNDVITSGFEPGSTFKPVTIAAGLEENIVTPESTFICDGGETVGGFHIACTKHHGEITLGEAIMYSCNDTLMQIVAQEGRDLFYKYQTSFGLGRKTGIDLPGEFSGIIFSVDKLNATELATSSFGQAFKSTMIQLATAYSSLVNGGYYYQPHVMKQIVNDNGATVKQVDKILVRQTISEETSDFLQRYLYQTVENGTARYAKVEGYSVGGKTGTAEKLPRGQGNYVVSFLGHVPAVNPKVVIYVMIDEPQNVNRQDDSSIATKFTSKILKEILPALGIYPEGDIDYLLTDDAAGNGTNTTTANNTSGNEMQAQGENSSGGTQENQSTEENSNSASGQDNQGEGNAQSGGTDSQNSSEGSQNP